MSETNALSDLSKGHPKRNELAQRITEIRDHDRNLRYSLEKGPIDYLKYFHGLSEFFSYVRTLPSKKVLDIGSGFQSGIHGLSNSPMARDIEVESTVMTNFPRAKKRNPITTHVTSAELLKGIPDQSIGGVLALNSIAYSDQPETAIRRIDQVLIPGGVIKATFLSHIALEEYGKDPNWLANKLGFKTYDNFLEELKRLGYDTEIAETPRGKFLNDVLVAIKPGGTPGPTAKDLLDIDFFSEKSQVQRFKVTY